MQAAIPDEQIISLIPGCQRGDSEATEALYDLYADRIYRYLLVRTGDPDIAADLTTELFLRVIKSITRFRLNSQRPAASFSAWLFRIAANLATDHHRTRRSRSETSLEDELSLYSLDPDPHGEAVRREEVEALAQAINQLGEEQRLVVIGKFAEEMSNVEIANCLGKTEGAVKSLQHRALRALGRWLRPEEGWRG